MEDYVYLVKTTIYRFDYADLEREIGGNPESDEWREAARDLMIEQSEFDTYENVYCKQVDTEWDSDI